MPASQGVNRGGKALFALQPRLVSGLIAEQGHQLFAHLYRLFVSHAAACCARRPAGLGVACLADASLQPLAKGFKAHGFGLFGTYGAAKGRNKIAFTEHDKVGIVHFQVFSERLPQGRKKCQRAAAKQDGRRKVAPVAKGCHRLHGNAVEYAGCNVAFRQVARHEVLYVGLGKDAAAGRHRIQSGRGHCLVVHLAVGATHQHCHLINESSRATGAVAVHAQLHALAVEEHHFCILAADVDQGFGFGITMTGKHGGGNNLLHKLGFHLLGSRHSHRPRCAEAQADGAEVLLNLVKITYNQLVNSGVVALVA